MANNVLEYLAQLKSKDPKRANWFFGSTDVGTNDFGFIKVKKCVEVIAGSHLRYDFRAAYTTNPTISPVLSRCKATVCAIWIPSSLYVPALRDGVQVKAGKTDYSFPTLNFKYSQVAEDYRDMLSSNVAGADHGLYLPYVPANGLLSELGMWRPYYQPVGFALSSDDQLPPPKNAIPLLGYIDFFRSYVMNTQVGSAPLRVRGYSRRVIGNDPNDLTGSSPTFVSQDPVDHYITRDQLDRFFMQVRRIGSLYPQGDGGFDISDCFGTEEYELPPIFATKNGSPVAADSPDGDWVAFNDNHHYEFRQTLRANRFTAFLSNSNVEYERSTARVQADDGGVITMEQIYHAGQVQSWVRKSIFKNSDYAEFCDAHYGVRPPTTLTKPLFLGAVSSWLSFNDVMATAQTGSGDDLESNDTLGSRASIGFGRMVTGSLRGGKDRPFVEFTALEPGYFMVLEWFVPEEAYYTGYEPYYDKLTLESLYYPEFDKDGYQDKQFVHLNEQVIDDFNSVPTRRQYSEYNVAYAQEPAYFEHMSTYNRMSGQMVDQGVYRHWVFHRDLQLPSLMSGANVNRWPSNIIREMTDVYVRPEDYNHIFANVQGLDNIQTFYSHDLKIYQPLSHRFLSY